MFGPELSVVVVILTGDENYLGRCLTALTQQTQAPRTEVLVPCDRNASSLLKLSGNFPGARFLSIDGDRTYAELRAIGVRESKAQVVALTEDHCIPSPDWCAQILRAHARTNAAIGGAVNKEGPDSALNWAFYLADYLRYMKPIPEGPTHNLTDCNVSYKRASLEAIETKWSHEFHENDVHEALCAGGDLLWLAPEILVYQQRTIDLRAAIRDRYTFGRLFASTRAANFSASQRLLYSVLSLLIPAVQLSRIAVHVLRKGRCRSEFFRSLPHLLLISTVWATGELVGYATGRAEESLTPGNVASVRPESQEAII